MSRWLFRRGHSPVARPRRRRRWLRRAMWILLAKVVLVIVGVVIFLWSGAADPILRRAIIHRLETATGARVELKEFSMRWWGLRARLRGFVLHGTEPAAAEPLFAADEVDVSVRLDSFWGRRISLGEVVLRSPRLHLLTAKDGSLNLPSGSGKGAPRTPLGSRLMDLRIQSLEVDGGWILYNATRSPLSLQGSGMSLQMSGSSKGQPLYVGELAWRNLVFTVQRAQPMSAALSVRFSLAPDVFRIEQAVARVDHSQLDATAEMRNFAKPAVSFRYRAWLRLDDLRPLLRKNRPPSGKVDFRGEGSFTDGKLRLDGSYSAQSISLPYPEFRASGIYNRASYHADERGLVIPDFHVDIYGGSVSAKVSLQFAGFKFRTDSQFHGINMASTLHALDRPAFPVEALHWDALISGETVETWSGMFQHFEVSGKTSWSPPAQHSSGSIPSSGTFAIQYAHDLRLLHISSGLITLPAGRITSSGLLGRDSTSLDISFETADLSSWNDFIAAIREASPKHRHSLPPLAGSVRWDGRILGPIAKPDFIGHLRGETIRYGSLDLDVVDADLTYSPSEFSLTHGRLQHGSINAEVEADLQLSLWAFLPGSRWQADVNLLQSSVEDLQRLLGLSYPLRGNLTGQFHGRGTRSAPSVAGLFDLTGGQASGLPFNRLRGRMNWTPEQLEIADAELRVLPREKSGPQGTGLITGSATYRFADDNLSLDLVGAGFPLESYNRIQLPRLPIGGRMNFHLKSEGPRRNPLGQGTFRIVDLRVGQDVIGSFEGKLSSDGREARLDVNSAMATGSLTGHLHIALSGEYPVSGALSVTGLDLDPFLVTALHLPPVTGHGVVDGDLGIAIPLAHPQGFAVDASLSRLVLHYANLQLENNGPVRFLYSNEELQISRATLRGPETNLEIAGLVQFSSARNINLRLDGDWNLRLLTSFFPDLESQGPAQIHATVDGTLSRPRVNGRMRIEKASARVADFPTGLSSIEGDLLFDSSRLSFDNVSAMAGGGPLVLAGSVYYAERPLRYDISMSTPNVRVRYPVGMSWLAGAGLRLTGTPESAMLSGRITINRLSLTEGLEIAGALTSPEGISGPLTSSPFLRNLQFDLEAVSAPGTLVEWPGAEIEADASLRVRGTWEHPILLGHIHFLSGEMSFAGNRYRVTRGDLNFANPFRIDPVLNIEATTAVQQYEITLNFSGPASKLTLAYRSDPPLPPNDIVTLLAMGTPGEETQTRSGAATQSGTAGASALLSEAISTQLGGRLEKLFGITRLRVDPGLGGLSGSGGSQNSAARVTVEQRVARNLTITYITNVTSSQQQVIQVEYNVNRNLSIVALRDQNGTFGLDFKIKKRFD